MTGRVFNIQRFSIHDGPGIRTTVFLKGCSLACVWCHNPESIALAPELAFFPNKCIRCGHCFEACETGALRLVPVGGASVPRAEEGRGAETPRPQDGWERRYQRTLCRVCGKCADACYAEAIVMEGRDVAAEEVVAEVLKDKPFYDNSGGGVTLSGGEPLLQADFCAEVLIRCKAQGVHTALDTAASVPWAAFEKALPHTDLVLLDLKLMDAERHRAATGAGNELILANARRLAEAEPPIVVRVPIIPGYTDDEANVAAIVDFVRGFPRLEYVELLPYHRFAEAKYRRLEREYGLEGIEAPLAEPLAALAAVVAARGLRVKVAPGARKSP
ncbi:MAG TPA: glycyl-radical enzyme activating protein [Planctomycetota bacterium]|nr:glycyl-radical enzyme activating protein [Planctomycetota bacterium]